MNWKRKVVAIDLGDEEIMIEGYCARGIALIEQWTLGGLKFWAVIHVPRKRELGFLFCNPRDSLPVAEEIALMQDWTKVRKSSDLLQSTHNGFASIRTRHVFLQEVPDGLHVRGNIHDPSVVAAA